MRPTFLCPTCRQPLGTDERGWSCAAGHHFDRAREGYVNLLPGGRLASRPAGDDERMVRARRALFDSGAYRPVQSAVADAVAASGPAHVLDSGCGEGSYLAAVTERSGAAGWGIDVAKIAVKLAARRHRHHRYAVASAHVLPFADGVLDAVVSVFSPRDFPEMGRVLAPGGAVIVATPGAEHLRELKGLIYREPRAHRSAPADAHAGWEPTAIDRVSFDLSLDDPALRLHLLEMTPYWWSTGAAQRERVMAEARVVRVDVEVRTFRRAT